MKIKLLYFLIFCFVFCFKTFSQSVIHSSDTTICQGQKVLLHASFDHTFTTVGMDTIDDVYSVGINIGFPFTFYEKTYNKCTLSSNSYISFDTSYFSQPFITPNFSQFAITNAIPSNLNPLNSIFGVWHDIDPSVPPYGIRTYLRSGVAPNRQFIYSFCNVPMYSLSCNLLTYSGQIILYEGTNNIEVHVGNKVLCPSWNTGSAIIGVQDSAGTKASFPAGYNFPTNWTATNQSWRFVWDTVTKNYTNFSIPYNPVPVNVGGAWYLNGNLVSSDSSFLVNPNSTSTYYISALGCAGSTNDSVVVHVIGLHANTTIQNSNCSTGIGGSLSSIVSAVNWPVNIAWMNNTNNSNLGNTTLTTSSNSNLIDSLTPGIYSLILTDSSGCKSYDTFNIVASNFPPISFSQKNTTCPSDQTGYIVCAVQNTTNYNFIWSDKNHVPLQNHTKNSNDTLFNLKAGKYYIKIVVTPYCTKFDSITIISASFNLGMNFNNIVCAGSTNNYIATSNQINPKYYWNWNDNSPIDTINPINHTYKIPGNYLIKLTIVTSNGCSDTLYKTITVLKNITANFNFSQDIICLQQKLQVVDMSDQFPVNWIWNFGNGNIISNAQTATSSYAISGTYPVELIVTDSLCGIDTIVKFVTVMKPPPISLGDDKTTCIGSSVDLIPTGQAVSYLWSTGSILKIIKITAPQGTSQVWVEIKNSFGCSNRDTIEIITQPCSVTFPNAFTPNNDGVNDLFGILGVQIKKYNLAIYDRWGTLVYKYDGSDTKLGWDGKYLGVDQPDGIYIYYGKAIFFNDDSDDYRSNVHLIR